MSSSGLGHIEKWLPQRLPLEGAQAILDPALARQEAVVLQCRVELMAAQQALNQALVLLMRLEAERSRLSEDGPAGEVATEWEEDDAESGCTTDPDPVGRPGCCAGGGGSGLV